MELLLLSTLEWRVAVPTSASFVEHFLRAMALRAPRRRGLRAHARELLRRSLAGACPALFCAAFDPEQRPYPRNSRVRSPLA